ncbi:MAG TPA: hypothetical protein QGF58_17945 [Myxococcota bacterium]|nr:hypothetical protein [Myxococcota bacterium]
MSWSDFVRSLGLVDPLFPAAIAAGGDVVVALFSKRAVIWSLSTGEIQSTTPVEGLGVAVNDRGEIALPDASGRPVWLGSTLLRLGWKSWTFDTRPHYAEDLDVSARARVFRLGDRILLADPMHDRPQELHAGELIEGKPSRDDAPCMDACLHEGRLVTVQRAGLRVWDDIKSWSPSSSPHTLQVLAVDSRAGVLWTVGLPGPELVGSGQRLRLPRLSESPRVWALETGVLVETLGGFFFLEPSGATHTLELPGRRKRHSGVLPVGTQVLVCSEPIRLYDPVGAALVRELATPAGEV